MQLSSLTINRAACGERREIEVIGMQGDANVILRNAINANQEPHMIDYADASLHVEELCMHADACRLSNACPNARSQRPMRSPSCLFLLAFQGS